MGNRDKLVLNEPADGLFDALLCLFVDGAEVRFSFFRVFRVGQAVGRFAVDRHPGKYPDVPHKKLAAVDKGNNPYQPLAASYGKEINL